MIADDRIILPIPTLLLIDSEVFDSTVRFFASVGVYPCIALCENLGYKDLGRAASRSCKASPERASPSPGDSVVRKPSACLS
jgi:hypothetical protein